jgi:nucleoside-diphosphate kinase
MHHHTLAILKPDCLKQNQQGQVIDRILKAGFKIIGMKMTRLSKAQTETFYEVHRGRPFYNDLTLFMSSGPCIPIALEKTNAVADFRQLIGATDPNEAAPGTIRKEFAASKQLNVVHGSDSDENAAIEIGFFFSKSELIAND